MSVCGQNAVFHGHTYSRLCDSGFQSAMREHTIYSMDTQWTNPELTASAPNSHLGMSDHQRSFVGPHAMPGLPVMDHWPSPPIAHSHHINNGNNNGNSNNSLSNNNNNSTGPCIQNQCKMPNDVDTSSMLENNSSSILIKSGDCPVINDNNNKSNRNNNNNNNNNSDSTNQSDGDGHPTRQNHIGSVVLHGVAIVSLIIDNKERLCLAQISNTLLKEYSYNEIHNRRVALGITCVQCTPVQLEILRRAGAMPVSSRRCGMITKREAERLVKSFLEDNAPPKLPEDFAFDVIHDCGWGCRGLFEPARYNSSRAKCIKCMYCSMYFSPNKFIFHFHRTPGAKYNHPDAANFNSWRRHLKLYQVQDKDELTFKWEDVKAMFNGGTRKKIGSSSSSSSSAASPSSSSLSNSKFSPHLSSSHHHHHSHHHHQSVSNRTSSYQHSPSTLDGASSAKKAKTSMMDANSFLPKPAPFSNLFNPYGWLTASHNKAAAYPFMTMNSAQSMCFGFPPQIPANKDALMDRMKSAPVGVGNPTGWMNRNPVAPFQLASMDLLWDKTFGFPSAAAVAALGGFRNGAYPNSIFPGAPNPMGMEMSEHLSPPRDNTPCISPNPGMPHKMMASPGCHERGEKGGNRMSAFTRVVPSMSPPSSASLSPQHSNTDRNTPSRNEDDDDDIDHNTEEADGDYGHVHDNKCLKTENGQTNIFACDFSTHRDIDDSEEIDVEEDSDDKKRLKCSNQRDLCQGQPCNPIQPTPVSQHSYSQHVVPEEGHLHPSHHPTASSPSLGPSRHSVSPLMRSDDDCGRGRENRSPGHESTVSDESDTERDNQDHPRDMIKEDVHGEDTKSEKDDRKDEEEVTGLKDPYREDVGREKTFQEHMSKQLEMLRETLTTELEQERKIRYSLQEKLKQAHEALNSFSCGLLTANGDSNSFKDTNPVPR